ncbi:MAG: hypothetical protein ACRDG3_03670 [Tepidiformaceae bacterium]
MSFEELAVEARIEEIRRDIARWARGQAVLSELRVGQPRSRSRFGFKLRRSRGPWSLTRELAE